MNLFRGLFRRGTGVMQGRFKFGFASPAMIPEALPFLDPIDEICERPAPLFMRSTLYLVAALFLSLLVIAAVVKLDVVVVAGGRIVTESPPVVLQPLEHGIIREFRVHPGDKVQKGQVLATLDPTFAEADVASLEKQSHALSSQVRRLEAETQARPFDTGAYSDADDTLQSAVYQERAAEYATRLRAFDEDIQHLRAAMQTEADDRASLQRQLSVAREVEEMRSDLLQSQAGSRLNLLEAQSVRMRAERDEEAAGDRLRDMEHSTRAREAERQAFVDSWHREQTETLVRVRTELAQVTSALAKASRLHELVVVTAPVDGTILDIAPRSEGSVLREAEPLLTIVPKDAPLIAEVMISSGDVGHTRVGADTKLKIDAYPYSQYGLVDGQLQTVSEESSGGNSDSASTGRGGAFHRARVALVDGPAGRSPLRSRLFPGMTLTAEIKSGSRSVLAYFLYPLTRGLNESLREP